MQHHEHILQVQCVRWFRFQFKDCIIYAVPNGVKTSLRTAGRLKAEGMLAGVPDLCIPHPRQSYHGLYIEMKYGKNKLSPSQMEIITRLDSEGYKTAICRSLDEFMNVVKDYFNNKQEKI